jgi:hypothetical protein
LEDFIVGDYIVINRGNVTEEVVKIVGKTTTTFTVTELNYNHEIGETIYSCARKFWAKLTVPEDATGNTAQNFYDIGLRIRGVIESRV